MQSCFSRAFLFVITTFLFLGLAVHVFRTNNVVRFSETTGKTGMFLKRYAFLLLYF